MKFIFFVMAVAVSSLQVDDTVTVNPIRRVVTLLQNLQKEVQVEGKKEKDLYDKFMCYCKGNTDGLQKGIAQNEAEALQLAAEVKSKSGRKQQLDQEVLEHKQDRTDAKATIDKATNIRDKEREAYVKES